MRITAPHFVAGVWATDGVVTTAAPICRYMLGWTGRQLAEHCDSRGWSWERVTTLR